LGREVPRKRKEIELVVSMKRNDVDLVGASDTTIGPNSQVDDQVQPETNETGETKGEDEVQEEEKKAATG